MSCRIAFLLAYRLHARAGRDGGDGVADPRYAMLDLAAKKGIKPILDEILPMSQAAKAVEAVKTNKVRYRYVLKNDLD